MTAPRTAEELEARLGALRSEMGEEMTLDALTRDWKIFQRRRGHRHSTDDLLTAWYAASHVPAARTLLDLGSGIGSVGLALLWHFAAASLTAIEVQAISHRLLRENCWANGVEPRVRVIHGDLRTAVPEGAFDLVTGSPPYFDVKNGIVSADAQRASARFELHGDVSDYCRAAKKALASGGTFVFCFPTVQRTRAERAADAAGLTRMFSRDVIPKEGLPPLFSLFLCRRAEDAPMAPPVLQTPFVVRDSAGAHTADTDAARTLFGLC